MMDRVYYDKLLGKLRENGAAGFESGRQNAVTDLYDTANGISYLYLGYDIVRQRPDYTPGSTLTIDILGVKNPDGSDYQLADGEIRTWELWYRIPAGVTVETIALNGLQADFVPARIVAPADRDLRLVASIRLDREGDTLNRFLVFNYTQKLEGPAS